MDKALKSVLDWWEDAGVDVPDVTLAAPRRNPKPRQAPAQKSAPAAARSAPVAPKPASDAAPIAAKAKTLTELKAAMDKFDAGTLSDHARQCVFARGNPEADIMVIGEAPGREEDIAGKPFIGPAGQLLDKMLASIGLTEETAYLTTVVNWRLPKGRNPTAEDIAICAPFLHRHIELSAPKVIMLVGGTALTALTGLSSVMKNRGQWQVVKIAEKDIPALPIYHPTTLLKQPMLKKEAWRDLLALRERLGDI
jgi:DNA polymerase